MGGLSGLFKDMDEEEAQSIGAGLQSAFGNIGSAFFQRRRDDRAAEIAERERIRQRNQDFRTQDRQAAQDELNFITQRNAQDLQQLNLAAEKKKAKLAQKKQIFDQTSATVQLLNSNNAGKMLPTLMKPFLDNGVSKDSPFLVALQDVAKLDDPAAKKQMTQTVIGLSKMVANEQISAEQINALGQPALLAIGQNQAKEQEAADRAEKVKQLKAEQELANLQLTGDKKTLEVDEALTERGALPVEQAARTALTNVMTNPKVTPDGKLKALKTARLVAAKLPPARGDKLRADIVAETKRHFEDPEVKKDKLSKILVIATTIAKKPIKTVDDFAALDETTQGKIMDKFIQSDPFAQILDAINKTKTSGE